MYISRIRYSSRYSSSQNTTVRQSRKIANTGIKTVFSESYQSRSNTQRNEVGSLDPQCDMHCVGPERAQCIAGSPVNDIMFSCEEQPVGNLWRYERSILAEFNLFTN